MIIASVKNKQQVQASINIDKEPNQCPFCHRTIIALRMDGYLCPDFVEIHYRCPYQPCQKGFIAYYQKITTASVVKGPTDYEFTRTSVGNFIPREFDHRIVEISPMFPVIYNQALEAENLGMDQISGMGYRKSIEFLIKDYLCKRFPDKETEIKASLLGKSINDFVDNENIKEISKRAIWLGNDETHYTRKWEDRDINDMKKLIDIANHWIEMEQRTEEYIREMPQVTSSQPPPKMQ